MEIDRDKQRNVRDNQRQRDNRDNRDVRRDNNRGRDGRWPGGRDDSRDRMYGRDRDRWNDRDNRYRQSGNGGMDGRKRREEKNDKFVGSLSEGQKAQKDSSSDSDVGNVTIADDDDDEEKIIEARRKKREELLKVSSF